MEILRKANSLCDNFNRKKKKLRDLQLFLSEIIQQQSQGCQNCKRKDPPSEESGMVPYDLEFKLHPQNSLIKRQSFRFVEVKNSSEDTVVLCLECSEFLTNQESKVAKGFENVWPSFVWNLLSDKEILNVYGVHVWRFLPEKWRYWWIEAVHQCDIFEDVTIDSPSAIFSDITNNICDMKRGLHNNTLSELIRVCNHHLIPSVLCPWGETEYIHQCGTVPYDILIQRYLPKCYIPKVHQDRLLQMAN